MLFLHKSILNLYLLFKFFLNLNANNYYELLIVKHKSFEGLSRCFKGIHSVICRIKNIYATLNNAGSNLLAKMCTDVWFTQVVILFHGFFCKFILFLLRKHYRLSFCFKSWWIILFLWSSYSLRCSKLQFKLIFRFNNIFNPRLKT